MPKLILVETLDDGSKVERPEWGQHSPTFKEGNVFPYCVHDTSVGNATALIYCVDDETWDRNPNDYSEVAVTVENGWHTPRTVRHVRYSRLSWATYKDPDWEEREAQRLRDGTYEKLPWDLEPIPHHYAHFSVDDGAKVAFTPSPEKGMVDIQVRMKPGRYLTKFYPQLPADDVRRLAIALDKQLDVKFAVTAEDIVRVYNNGPSSCMSHPAAHFECQPTHPCEVYGDSDLQLAYLSTKPLSDPDFRASARALVWPENKTWVRIYGDEGRLGPALEALGYAEDDSFEGAMIRVVRDKRGRLVLPYLDGDVQNVTLQGDKLEINVVFDDAALCANRTDGLAEGNDDGNYCDGNYCDYYEETRYEETVYIRDLDQSWCESAAERHAFFCNGYGEYFSYSADSAVVEDDRYSREFLEGNATYCELDDEWVLNWRSVETVTTVDTGESCLLANVAEHELWQDPTTLYWYRCQPADPSQLEPPISLSPQIEAAAARAAA